MTSLLPIKQFKRIFKIIKHNGGLTGCLYNLWRFDTLKEGKYVGTDSFGNKYFENNFYMLGRNRWVEYNDDVQWEYEAHQVTSEWYGWLHYRTDELPSQDCAKVEIKNSPLCARWILPHEENLSGTRHAYVPFTTVPPHVQVWDDGDSIIQQASYLRLGKLNYKEIGCRLTKRRNAINAIDQKESLSIVYYAL